MPASEIREALGLEDADAEGQHKGYRLWGLEHLLVEEGKVEVNKNCKPQRIMLKR